MKDICNFITEKKDKNCISYHHFVYEMEYKKLRQPFFRSFYTLHIVFKGNAKLIQNNREYELEQGSVFFSFPDLPYKLIGDEKFTFSYVSFEGREADLLMKKKAISPENPVYPNHRHLLDFWLESIRRFSYSNAETLTASVLMHTLSYIDSTSQKTENPSDKFSLILEYLNKNYMNCELSLCSVAAIFFYSDKYLSALFKKNTGVRFSDYLNRIRIEKAKEYIENRETKLSKVANLTGFSDQFYFSKVFKSKTGISPSKYAKSKSNAS